LINGKVRFEFVWLPFLADEDFRAMLTQSYDLTLFRLFRKTLSPGDIVLDVGANVGYVSAVAATYVGTTGEVHGFEPLKICFNRLNVLSTLNPEYRFIFNNVAVGEEEGVLPISYDPRGESRNASLVPGEMGVVTENVPVRRLDAYIKANITSPERIRRIKIDVEGYEFPVLKGMEEFFSQTQHRPLIVCEVKPWDLKRLGYSLEEFDGYMKRFGYLPYDALESDRSIDFTALSDMEIVLFRPARLP